MRQQAERIDLRSIDVEATEYITTKLFVESLDFPEVNSAFWRTNAEELGLYVYTFHVKLPQLSDTTGRLPRSTMEWDIRKRVSDFMDLERTIRNDPLYRFKAKDIPKETPEDQPEKVQKNMKKYLNQLFGNPEIQVNPPDELLRFLEISYVNLGSQQKFKECFLKKQAGGRYGESKCARCGTLWGKWDQRYFCITSEAVMYSKGPNEDNSNIREVLNFDHNFSVLHGKVQAGNQLHIILQSTTRKLVLSAPNIFCYIDFLARLKEAIKVSPYTQLHRFDSFAPIRMGQTQWYSDGKGYFSDMYAALQQATQSVYITDWWLSPELYLRRPVGDGEKSTQNRESGLDIVLKGLADRGVQVMILVYNEPTLALNNDSYHTKTHLESLSRNIKVLRHPGQKIPYLWSHHEKLVVIDQKVGFMGGLDLCFGRMDSNEHYLFDQAYETSDKTAHDWPGIDYSNSRVKDFYNVKQHQVCLLGNKREKARMPWHDIALQIIGEPVVDMARHFIQYWNFVTIEMDFKKRTQNQMLQAPNQQEEQKQGEPNNYSFTQRIENLFSRQDQYINFDQDVHVKHPTQPENFVGYTNGHFEAFVNRVKLEMEDEPLKGMDIELGQKPTHRMSSVVQRPSTNPDKQHSRRLSELSHHPAKQPTEHHHYRKEFLNMILHLKNSQRKEEEQYYRRLPKIRHDDSTKQQVNTIRTPEPTPDGDTPTPDEDVIEHYFIHEGVRSKTKTVGTSQCQMLRSASRWSVGCKDVNTEMSIQVLFIYIPQQLAYLQLINEAKEFIYIENQFFISCSAGSSVENQIAQALISRIRKAAANNEKFKVVVFLPLLPGFEGEIDDPASAVMKVQLYWEYHTISRGGSSILEQLATTIKDPSQYIEFFSLRQHALSPESNQPCTEIIYIHSKCMIVDDEIALIGSANINDRSLMGNRDSEIAMIVHDDAKTNSFMNGQPQQKPTFAHKLRCALYSEHFGLPYDEVKDPLSPQLQDIITQRTTQNTNLYRTIFACYPDDTVHSLSDYDKVLHPIKFKFKKTKQLEKYEEFAPMIQGHAVQFPLHFLKNENLKIGIFHKEYLCPEINFT